MYHEDEINCAMFKIIAFITHTWAPLARPHDFTEMGVYVHMSSLVPPHFSEVLVPRQESELSLACVLGVSSLSLFTNVAIGF